MVDRVKPLGIESVSTGGTETNDFPTEMDPTEDYASVKGLAFEGLDTYRYEKLYRVLTELIPDGSVLLTYSGNNVVTVEYFITASQITANRTAKSDFTYTSNNLTSAVTVIYQTDGTTIARTITNTYTYSGNNLQSYTEVTT